jgi:hypothetical protein
MTTAKRKMKNERIRRRSMAAHHTHDGRWSRLASPLPTHLPPFPLLLLEPKQLDVEIQVRIRRYLRPHGLTAVAVVAPYRERRLLPHPHRREPLVPPPDDLPGADRELERLAPVETAVELRPVRGEGAGVVGLDLAPGGGRAEGSVRRRRQYRLHDAAVLGDGNVDGLLARHVLDGR